MIKLKKLFYRPEFVLWFLLLILTTVFVWQKDNWQRNVLSSDGRGYYAFLPAIFLFQDLSYASNANAIEKEMGYKMGHHYILTSNEGKTFNKCFPGVAILQMPLFLLATFLSYLFGYTLNGYSDLYLISVQMSAISACLIGFFYLKKLLILREVTVRNAIAISFLTVFGTNVFFYATNSPSMGHVFSFMMLSMFLFFAQKALKTQGARYYIFSAIAFSIVFLIRPTNGLVLLLVPFLAGSYERFRLFLRSFVINWRVSMYMFIAGGLVLALLPIIWYAQTGHFVVWSYSGEGFYFLNPQPLKVLFSFRNGLFIWAPISFVAMLGFFSLWKNDKFSTSFALLFFAFNIYIISSWWTFYYGGGFGQRALTEHHIFTGLLLGGLVNWIKPALKKVFYGLSFCLAFLSVFQGYQMNIGIIPPDFVNAEMYKILFLKTDKKYINECNATLDCRQYGDVIHVDYFKPTNVASEPIVKYDFNRAFGADAKYKIPVIDDDTQLFLVYSYTKKRNKEEEFNDVFLVIEGKSDEDKSIYYQSFTLYDIRKEALNSYKKLKITLQLPKKDISTFDIYIWNKGQKTFDVKDIDIQIQHVKP